MNFKSRKEAEEYVEKQMDDFAKEHRQWWNSLTLAQQFAHRRMEIINDKELTTQYKQHLLDELAEEERRS